MRRQLPGKIVIQEVPETGNHIARPCDQRAGGQSFLDRLSRLAELGFDHAIISPRHPLDDAALEVVTAVIDCVHAIPHPASRMT